MAGREYVSVLMVALLVIASGGATFAGGPSTAVQSDHDGTETAIDRVLAQFVGDDAADAVYVDDSGNAVFRYESAHDVPSVVPIQGQLGVDAGSGLAHARYGADLEYVTINGHEPVGTTTIWATPASITATGDLFVEDPEDLESLSVDLERRQTVETSTSRLDLTGTVTNDTRPSGSIDTEGTLETTATTVSTSGSMRTTVPNGTDGGDSNALDEHRELTITETDDGIQLRASENRTIGEWERERWATEADARTSLENRYDEVAILLGGEASVSLDAYTFEADGNREMVDLEYTVDFTDVEDGLADRVTDELQATTDIELDDHERRVIADRIARVSIEEVSITVTRTGPETTLEWDAEIHGTDELILGIVEIAGSNDRIADGWADQYETIRTDLEAQREAGLVQRTTWNASLEHEQAANRTAVDAVVESDTENWSAYGAEREARSLGPIPSTKAGATVAVVDGDLEGEYEYETEAVETETAAFEQLLRFGDADLGPPIDAAITPLVEGAVDIARVDAAIDADGAELESAAAFDGVLVRETADEVRAIHAETTTEGTSVFVTTAAFAGTDRPPDEIRAHPRVGPETTVYGPGEWDREFPSVESDDVRAFLAVDDDATDDVGDRDVAFPWAPFVVGMALFVASVPVAVLGRRAVGRRWD